MKYFLLVFVLSISSLVYAADKEITITVPEEKVQKVLDGYLTVYPNAEQMEDPTWVDPQDGSTPPMVPKYTDAQWIREKVRRLFVSDVMRGLEIKARQAVKVEHDEGVAE